MSKSNNCDCCGQPRSFAVKRRPNYQKLVEGNLPAAIKEVPLIGSSPVMEYRVTSDMRHKPADVPGVRYIQNFSALDHNDRTWWLLRKAEETRPWIGDGTYKERRPDHLHHFGTTTRDLQEEDTCHNVLLAPPSPPGYEIVEFSSRNGL